MRLQLGDVEARERQVVRARHVTAERDLEIRLKLQDHREQSLSLADILVEGSASGVVEFRLAAKEGMPLQACDRPVDAFETRDASDRSFASKHYGHETPKLLQKEDAVGLISCKSIIVRGCEIAPGGGIL